MKILCVSKATVLAAALSLSATGCLTQAGSENLNLTPDQVASVSTPGPAITDAEFQQEVLNSSVPVIVEFWEVGCMYCADFNTTLNDYASEHSGQVTVVLIDIDTNPIYLSKYSIQGTPTSVLFKSGAAAKTIVGDASLSYLKNALDPLL